MMVSLPAPPSMVSSITPAGSVDGVDRVVAAAAVDRSARSLAPPRRSMLTCALQPGDRNAGAGSRPR